MGNLEDYPSVKVTLRDCGTSPLWTAGDNCEVLSAVRSKQPPHDGLKSAQVQGAIMQERKGAGKLLVPRPPPPPWVGDADHDM